MVRGPSQCKSSGRSQAHTNARGNPGGGSGRAQAASISIRNAQPILFTPIATVDFDFLFRKTPTNIRKRKAIAKSLGGMLLRPYHPASGLYRITRDDDQLQGDFMGRIDGYGRSKAATGC